MQRSLLSPLPLQLLLLVTTWYWGWLGIPSLLRSHCAVLFMQEHSVSFANTAGST